MIQTEQTPNPDTVNIIEAYLYGEDENGKNTTEVVIINLEVPESFESGEFTDFDNLTQSQVTSWVEGVLGAEGITIVRENILSRNHTELMMKHIGIDIEIGNEYCKVKNNNNILESMKYNVPGDPSTASFFAVAALLLKKSIILKNILGNPTRIGFYSILKEIGINVEWLNKDIVYGEIIGDLRIQGKANQGIDINKEQIPAIIDELPILSIVATQAEGMMIVSGAEELRYKESAQ